MAGGFRAAEAFVEVTADLRDGPVLLAARRAAEGVDQELTSGAERAGARMTTALTLAGGQAGSGWSRDARGRLHDDRGRFVADAMKIGVGMGGSLGGGLTDSMSGVLKSQAGPYLTAALVAAGTLAAPLAGAAIGAGIMAGVGAVAIGGGIALALQDPEIKHAASQTGEEIMDILKGAAAPFKGAMLESLDQVERHFKAWDPWLRRIGQSASSAMEPLTTGVTGLVTRMLPGLDRALANMGPLWNAIRDGLVETGQVAGDIFDSLSDNGAELAVAVRTVFALINGSIATTGMVINGLTEAFGFVIEMVIKAGEMAVEWGAKMEGLPGPVGEIGRRLREMGEAVSAGGEKWDTLKNSATSANNDTSASTEKLTERQRLLTQSMGATVREAGSLKAAFDLLNGAALSAREAESNYQAALDAVTASIKENGRTLDLSTEKGRANDAVIRQLVGTVSAKAQAVYDETLATQGQAAAEAAATKVYEQGRAQLVKNLTQILGNAAAAEKLANEIMGIPKSWGTTVTNNAPAATGAVRTYVDWLNSIPKEVRTRMITEQHSVRGGPKEFARGGEATGGSGVRDDVPALLTAGEWTIRKSSVRALERIYGPGIMAALNNADGQGWRSLPITPRPMNPGVMGVDGLRRPESGVGTVSSHVVNIANVTLDASSVQSMKDVVDLVSGIVTSARSYKARVATVAGR